MKIAMKNQSGFTLIELMITVAVIGILSAIAYPSYQSHLIKSRRAAAQAQLVAVALQEQQYLLDARSYTSDLSVLKVTVPPSVSAYYTVTISVSASVPPAFTATATPLSGTPQANDAAISLNSAGTKLPSKFW